MAHLKDIISMHLPSLAGMGGASHEEVQVLEDIRVPLPTAGDGYRVGAGMCSSGGLTWTGTIP